MHRMQKWIRILLGLVIAGLGLYIIYRGFLIARENGFLSGSALARIPEKIEEMAVDTYLAALSIPETETEEIKMMERIMDELFPVVTQNVRNQTLLEKAERENQKASERLEEKGSKEGDEEKDLGEKAAEPESGEEPEEGSLDELEAGGEAKEEGTERENASGEALPETETDPPRETESLPWEEMKDFQFLLNNYYTLDLSTTADPGLLNLDALMGADLSIRKSDGPDILIYHTHSQETFIDSVKGEVGDSIVGVGDYLTELLEGYGYQVLHNRNTYDMVDGVLDRSKAYDLAAVDVAATLEKYPSIQVVIDLHRDGVDGYKFVTEINNKPTAKIMFYNGLSRNANGEPVTYLPNPYISDNLAFSFQLQMKAAQYYPGFTRNIYLQSLRYNLHFRPRSLLVEAGTQLNTVQEEYNAMEPLADILNQVLRGE